MSLPYVEAVYGATNWYSFICEAHIQLNNNSFSPYSCLFCFRFLIRKHNPSKEIAISRKILCHYFLRALAEVLAGVSRNLHQIKESEKWRESSDWQCICYVYIPVRFITLITVRAGLVYIVLIQLMIFIIPVRLNFLAWIIIQAQRATGKNRAMCFQTVLHLGQNCCRI